MSPEQAQEWLNRPEHKDVDSLYCQGPKMHALWNDLDREASLMLPFSVDHKGLLTREKPWHWPKPDASTPIDAKVWVRNDEDMKWEKAHYAKMQLIWFNYHSSWTAKTTCKPDYIVLANPDDLDEMPPIDLEV